MPFPLVSLGVTEKGCRGAPCGDRFNSGTGGADLRGSLFAQDVEQLGQENGRE